MVFLLVIKRFQIDLLLENTMVEIQDIPYLLAILWVYEVIKRGRKKYLKIKESLNKGFRIVF